SAGGRDGAGIWRGWNSALAGRATAFSCSAVSRNPGWVHGVVAGDGGEPEDGSAGRATGDLGRGDDAGRRAAAADLGRSGRDASVAACVAARGDGAALPDCVWFAAGVYGVCVA